MPTQRSGVGIRRQCLDRRTIHELLTQLSTSPIRAASVKSRKTPQRTQPTMEGRDCHSAQQETESMLRHTSAPMNPTYQGAPFNKAATKAGPAMLLSMAATRHKRTYPHRSRAFRGGTEFISTTQAQRPGPRKAWIATAMLPPDSLLMVGGVVEVSLIWKSRPWKLHLAAALQIV
jgi:hypothetical protein